MPSDPTVFWSWAGGCVWAPGGALGDRAHTAPSPEEIEKKLNVYRKGARIWKMLIFCQVGLRPCCPGVGAEDASAPARRGRGSGGGCPACAVALADHGLLQGGPGHLYLLKNKVATFAKVEKEEDMIQ